MTDAEALNYLGDYYVNVDNKKAFECYQFSANMGDTNALYNIGVCYYEGRGTTLDHYKAAHFLQLSYDQGNVKSSYRLGCCYYYGYGVKMDSAKAFKYFQSGVYSGCTKSCGMLGDCYLFGVGIDVNYKKALELHMLGGRSFEICVCEQKLLQIYKNVINDEDFDHAYALYVKYLLFSSRVLKKNLNDKLMEKIIYFPQVLNNLVVSYLI